MYVTLNFVYIMLEIYVKLTFIYIMLEERMRLILYTYSWKFM